MMTDVVPYTFRQDADYLYVTGCQQPGGIAVLSHEHGLCMFMPEFDRHDVTWQGQIAGVDAALETFKADNAYPLSKIHEVSLFLFIPGIPETHLVSGFISGLREDIRASIHTLCPTSLTEAFEFSLAKVEELAAIHAYSTQSTAQQAPAAGNSFIPSSMESFSLNLPSSFKTRRLTWEEQHECRKKGQCFNSDELFHNF
ncbi:hypothetical protein GIB67_001452 [Kingdonia uniflora]|uniref:Aminopeptidase P N-terminal domain-containing protein n=1 Tax=Kingdonia uniflora TaxID=39325 RepID=A0A7J7L6U3_9MAGN|nr:hypothetical protein GIB67_001452 [Kingdonia uniflora]